MMPVPSFLHFTPVPRRARYDGWSPELQIRFVAGLARGMSPGEAAGRLGMSRQGAYKLRRRTGAESFAAAWDAASRFARRRRAAPPSETPLRFHFPFEAEPDIASDRGEPRPAPPLPAGSTRDAFKRILASLSAQPASQGGKVDKGDANPM